MYAANCIFLRGVQRSVLSCPRESTHGDSPLSVSASAWTGCLDDPIMALSMTMKSSPQWLRRTSLWSGCVRGYNGFGNGLGPCRKTVLILASPTQSSCGLFG